MKYFFLAAIILVSLQPLVAQINKSISSAKFKEAAKSDTAYARFQSELNSWIQKASGRTTYGAEVRELFHRKKTVLARAYQQFGTPVTGLQNTKPVLRKPYAINPELAKNFGKLKLHNEKTISPPAQGNWHYVDLSNANTITTTTVDNNTCTIIYNVPQTTIGAPSMKQAHYGFKAQMDTPADPGIIAARIRFEYSFFYTGWDTHGAHGGIHLVFGTRRNNEFNSEALTAWTDTTVFAPGNYVESAKFCIIDQLLPSDSIAGEFGELHADKEGSFTFDGYIKPNAHLLFYMGFGYDAGSEYGINGHYLYGEFRIKKVTVTYYKSLPQ
jgi:hypothetical protein